MQTLKVFSPFDETLIDELMMMDEEAIENILSQAHSVYQDRSHWLPSAKRIEILDKFLQLMELRRHDLALASAMEGGKPLIDSAVEVERAISGIRYAISQIMHDAGQQIPMGLTPSSEPYLAYTYKEPVGVVLAISAFNHPVNLIIHQVIPAVAVGCPVIVKPAATTPLSCVTLVNMLYEAGLPKAWCQILLCDNQQAERVVSDSRVSFLSFIGSSKVGWYLRSRLSPGAHCALEHGGAAPIIVDEQADLEQCVPSLVKGGYYHAGQVCVSVQRVYVHHKLIKVFAKKMTEMTQKLLVGDPTHEETQVGPLIGRREVNRVDDWVKQAIAKGARLLCGGQKIGETCYQPTLLMDPPADVNVSTQEIFGPVVCLYTYKERRHAIEQANQLPYFFQAGVFSKNIDVAIDCVEKLNATAVMVNEHSAFRVDWMPFGGRRHSGLGVGGIPYSMQDLTYEKMMVIKRG